MKKRSLGLRVVGIAMLGLIGGLLLGVVVQDFIAVTFMSQTDDPSVIGSTFTYLLAGCGVLGAVIAVVVYNRQRARRMSARAKEKDG